MLTLGIDIGSASSKCVVLQDGRELAAWSLVAAGIGTGGAEKAFQEALEKAGAKERDVAFQMATGYGRLRWAHAGGELSELSAHALGCRFFQPDAGTVIDIGGQDAKVISLDECGVMRDFSMNDKCAAGTGRFLEVMARILCVGVEELGGLAAQARAAVPISSTCTVFAESEVISQLANGADRAGVAAGVCESVAARAGALAKRVGVREEVWMTGGVAQNDGVRLALSKTLGTQVRQARLPQLNGALGAALAAYRRAAGGRGGFSR